MNPSEKKFANYSQASRLRQAAIPPSVRRARASAAARAKWAAMTPEDRKAHSQRMTRAKQFGASGTAKKLTPGRIDMMVDGLNKVKQSDTKNVTE